MGAALDHGLGADAGTLSGIGDAFLAIRDVGKQFAKFVALERVSLNIASGEFVSIFETIKKRFTSVPVESVKAKYF
jgi:hypothetical protein